MTPPSFFPLSGTALLITVGDRIDVALTSRIVRFLELLDASGWPGIIDVVPSYTTVLVKYDNSIAQENQLREELTAVWNQVSDHTDNASRGTVTIPAVFGGEFGEDLEDVSAHTGLSPREVIERHLAGSYTVGALGFSPGFAYLIGLAPELATPRRSRPRTRVPAGSIGIGGEQTGIYALSTPGGWNLIGRTPRQLFIPGSDDPLALQMGDHVVFQRMSPEEFHREAAHAPTPDPGMVTGEIEILSPGLQTTVQDLGRHGFGRFGISPNGAADRRSLVAANCQVGNPDNAAGLEMTLAGPALRFRRRAEIVVTGADLGPLLNNLPLVMGRCQGVMPGDELSFRTGVRGAGARSYLAVAGGIDVAEVMGSRSTDLTAGIGGYRGRALQSGDRLPIGSMRRSGPSASAAPTPMDRLDRIEVVPGPQADRFSDEAWDTLLHAPFTVSPASNRVGLRLDGPKILPLGSADIISEGIVTGVIQVTGEGQPIVMLPAHATIGGYTKIATVIDDDLDRLGQLRPGDEIRFTCRYRTS